MLLLDAIGSLDLTGDPVAIPMTRDVLLIAGSDDSEGLGLMLDLADEHKENPRPICPVPHRLVEGEWQVWTPPADSPHFDRVQRNQLEHAASEYAEQKRLMEKQNEQSGTDVFVASFSAIEKGEKIRSYSVWAEPVPTWLPKTDYVASMSADEQPLGLVPWDRVERIMGTVMRQLDCYPPRWFVESFSSFPAQRLPVVSNTTPPPILRVILSRSLALGAGKFSPVPWPPTSPPSVIDGA